jgi:IclR family acetate operon transcriptional repressor
MASMGEALSRTVLALDLLAAHPEGMSVTELAQALGTSKSTSSRLLAALVEVNLVERDAAQRHFLDVRIWSWGVQAARRLTVLDVARPHIAIAVREAGVPAYVAVVRGDQTLYLESTTLSHEYAMLGLVSYAVPVYACAPGKAVLAFSPAEAQERVLDGPLKKFTPLTLATREELSAELETIRSQGYAVNRGEHYDNGRLAVAAPILDQRGFAVAAVCFYGLPDEGELERVTPALVRLGQVISSSLGYSRSLGALVG